MPESKRSQAIAALAKRRGRFVDRREDGVVKSARMRELEVAKAAQQERRIDRYRRVKEAG